MSATNAYIFRGVGFVVLILSLLFGCFAFVSQAEAAENDRNSTVATDIPYEFTNQTSGSGLALTVSWNTPKCGEPSVFYFQGKNGSGDYRYYLNLIQVDASGYYSEDAQVIDPTRLSYQESQEMSFTFYASGNYDIWVYVMDMQTHATQRLQFKVAVNDPLYPSVSKVADRIAAECVAAGNSTDYDKALWLHDWIIDNCEYDNSLVYCGAEGALVRGIGTCESYHRAYVMLLDRVGIPTKRIEGNGHVWTGVQLDGKWVQVDATWDDSQQFTGYPDSRHMYFGMDDRIAGFVHSDYQNATSKLGCNSLELNYFIKSGKIKEWSEPYVTEITSNLKAGRIAFTFNARHSGWPDNYKIVMGTLISYDLSMYAWDGIETSKALSVAYENNVYTAIITESQNTVTTSQSTNPGTDNVSVNETDSVNPPDSSSSLVVSNSVSNSSGGNKYPLVSQVSVSAPPSNSLVASGGVVTQESLKSKGVWKHLSGRWWYQHSDGSYTRNNWELIDGVWYLFDSAGWMRTGWVKKGGTWYYLSSSGALKTGWLKREGVWYYLSSSGAMKTGWQKISGKWYYLKSSGAMVSNRWVGNYYLTGSGAMAVNTWIGRYHVNKSGIWDATR